MKQPIRLTNKTAIALRKNAQKMRMAYYAAAVLLSMAMAAAAVYLGILWLPAVPLMVILCVLLDCVMVMRARSQYLLLIGQAICTEAAAREIRADSREQKRKERAVSDFLEAKEDVKKPVQKKMQEAKPFFEKGMNDRNDEAALMGKTVALAAVHAHESDDGKEADAPRRRRQQKSLQLLKNDRAK